MPVPQGRRYRFVCFALLSLAMAISVPAQTSWTRNTALKAFKADDSWGPVWSKGGSRLACDKENTLFLLLGDSLLISEAQGRAWKAATVMASHAFGTHAAFTVGANGLVLWGNTVSADHGRNWATRAGQSGFATAFAVLPNGNTLMGGGYDHIELSVDSGKAWKQVHMGQTFGNIVDFACDNDAWAFAAPYSDGMLASKDYGKTWGSVDSLIGAGSADNHVAQFLAVAPGTASVWAYGRENLGKSGLMLLSWYHDALILSSHAVGKGFPDSAITALQASAPVYPNGQTLWVGSWGQGVFSSSDQGATWTARNQGLTDLHVEALVLGANGTVHALTKDGLFALGSGTGIFRAGAPRRAARGPVPGGFGILFGNGSEVVNPSGVPFNETLFRADGRLAFPRVSLIPHPAPLAGAK